MIKYFNQTRLVWARRPIFLDSGLGVGGALESKRLRTTDLNY